MSTIEQSEGTRRQSESDATETRYEVTGVRAERFPAVAADRAGKGEVAIERRGGRTFLLVT